MAGKREENRAALRQSLLSAAQAQIIANGQEGLKARDITKDAGCGLGTLYSAFDDLDHLVVCVNTETLKMLAKTLDKFVARQKTDDGRIVALAQGYLGFACDHKNLWEALFNYKFADKFVLPESHLKELALLFDKIAVPLAGICPDLNEEERSLKAKTLFSAVHGIVSISLQDRYVAVPRAELERQLIGFVEEVLAGMK